MLGSTTEPDRSTLRSGSVRPRVGADRLTCGSAGRLAVACHDVHVMSLPALRSPRRVVGGHTIDFEREMLVMAIINRTPDSFFDQGENFVLDRAVRTALDAAAAGANWVDIGGVPFSPDAEQVDAAEELDRIVPVVEAVSAQSDVVISVDTWRSSVAAACVRAGASVVNDTSGMFDPELAPMVADTGATLVLTHSLAAPGEHLRRPRYRDVVDEVRASLAEKVDRAMVAGVPESRLMVDPGPDLNKNTRHTLELVRRFSQIADLGLPSLVALSNKDFVGETLDRPKGERVVGSAVAAAWCLAAGGRVLRVHDVRAGVDTINMSASLLGWREPARLRHNIE